MASIRLPRVNCPTFCVVDEAGTIILERQSSTAFAPWSTTKVCTFALACAHVGDWDAETHTITSDDTSVPSGSTTANLVVGDTLSIRSIAHGALWPSGNDAAKTMAKYVGATYLGGSSEVDSYNKAITAMNALATAQGFVNTHYVNPHGYAVTGHYSCTYDMARLGLLAFGYPIASEMYQHAKYVAFKVGNPTSPYVWDLGVGAYGVIPWIVASKGGSGWINSHTDPQARLASITVCESGGRRIGIALNEPYLSPEAAGALNLQGPSRSLDNFELSKYAFSVLGVDADMTGHAEENISDVFYSGTWGGVGPDASLYTDWYANESTTASSTANTIAYMDACGIRCRIGPDKGIARVWVDDVLVNSSLDLYNSTGLLTEVFRTSWARPGWHRVGIEVLGAKNSLSSSTAITFDGFNVTSKPDPEDRH